MAEISKRKTSKRVNINGIKFFLHLVWYALLLHLHASRFKHPTLVKRGKLLIKIDNQDAKQWLKGTMRLMASWGAIACLMRKGCCGVGWRPKLTPFEFGEDLSRCYRKVSTPYNYFWKNFTLLIFYPTLPPARQILKLTFKEVRLIAKNC